MTTDKHHNSVTVSVTQELFDKGLSNYKSRQQAEQMLAIVLKNVKGYAGMKRNDGSVYVVDVFINIKDPCLVIGAKDALNEVMRATSAWAGLTMPVTN